MNKLSILLISIGMFSLTACTTTTNNKFLSRISSISYKDSSGKDTARTFVWPSKYTAGIGTKDGMCVQGAATAEASNFSASFTGELAKILKGADANAAASFATTVMALNASNPQTTYTKDAYFYLCQIALNSYGGNGGNGSKFSPSDIKEMWNSVGLNVRYIQNTSGSPDIVSAAFANLTDNQLDDYRKYMKNLGFNNITSDNALLRKQISDSVDAMNQGSKP